MSNHTDEILDIYWEKPAFKPWGMELKTFCMFMHLSQFASSIIPLAGIILPIVMWQQFKHQHEHINQQGKSIINFMLSIVVSWFVIFLLFVLFFVVVILAAQEKSTSGIVFSFGIMLIFIIILSVSSLVYVLYVILAALKANNGQIGTYPLTIKFIR
jgi:uncharacterized Tic20 family protein